MIQRLQSSYFALQQASAQTSMRRFFGNSKADFISKLHISPKETGERIYWLGLLTKNGFDQVRF